MTGGQGSHDLFLQKCISAPGVSHLETAQNASRAIWRDECQQAERVLTLTGRKGQRCGAGLVQNDEAHLEKYTKC